MKTKIFKVSTSVGAHYVHTVGNGWTACKIAQQELGDGVEIYDAIKVGEYEEDEE